jgi:hypothetical protein
LVRDEQTLGSTDPEERYPLGIKNDTLLETKQLAMLEEVRVDTSAPFNWLKYRQ